MSRDLSAFTQQWLKNISEQNYRKKEAVIERDGGDVRLAFDQDGKISEYASETPLEIPETEHTALPVSPVQLYREVLAAINQAVRNSPLYSYLRDHETDYDSAKDLLDDEIASYMEAAGPDNPALFDAYASLPMFREWLVEDVLERNYQDVVADQRLAPERYADSPDAPEWIRVSPAVDNSEPEQAEGGTEISPAPETAPEHTGAGAPEQPENTDTAPVEPNLTPNVEQYLNLKAQYPDKLIGVEVEGYMPS